MRIGLFLFAQIKTRSVIWCDAVLCWRFRWYLALFGVARGQLAHMARAAQQPLNLRARLNIKLVFTSIGIPITKINQPHGRPVFVMEIPIHMKKERGKNEVFTLKRGPGWHRNFTQTFFLPTAQKPTKSNIGMWSTALLWPTQCQGLMIKWHNMGLFY